VCPSDRLPELIGLTEREKSPLWTAAREKAERAGGNTSASVVGVYLDHVDLKERWRSGDADVMTRMGLTDHLDPRDLDAGSRRSSCRAQRSHLVGTLGRGDLGTS
jgi:hypothetical protein